MLCTFRQFDEHQHGRDAGGKGRALAQLYQAGYSVPDGFIILASAFDDTDFLASNRDKIVACYHQLITTNGNGRVAVRSSGLAEDSQAASFAGEFETVLDVTSDIELFEAIQSVFASSRSERVKSYAKAQHLSSVQGIAVVVQQMLEPSYSGVLFTQDPVSGDTNTMAGNLTEGLGEQLVSGQITADTFTIHSPTGSYNGPAYFEPHQQALLQLAQQLEAELHAPQDIEWAIEDDKLYVLQSRPITNLSPTPEVWNDTLDNDCLWTNTNIGEALVGVPTPFSWSVIAELFDAAVGKFGNTAAVGQIAGRGYTNVSVFTSALGKLGVKRAFILEYFSQLLGHIPEQIHIPAVKVTWRDLFRFLALQTGLSMWLLFSHKQTLKWVRDECPQWCEDQYRKLKECSNNQELLKFYEDFEVRGIRSFSVVVFVTGQFLIRLTLLKAAMGKVLNPEDLEIMLSGLGGEQQLQSMEPLMAISAMMKGDITREEFARSYGHRGPLEAEFAEPRSGEDPDWIDKLVSQWQDSNLEDLLDMQRSKRDRIWASLELTSPRQARRLRRLFVAAAKQAQNREYARSEAVRQGWIARRWVQRIAEINNFDDDLYFLTKSEIVDYLSGDVSVIEKIEPRKETFAIYSQLPVLPNIISGRFDPFQWSKDPKRRTDYFDAHHSYEANDEDLIQGFPGSAGVVEGTVRLLESHEQMDEFLPGEILVTSYTNVGWTPLFPGAVAIVTDIGAPLSHAAIVARELGIPAVVGTGSATMKIKTGDRIKVNGSEGVVELLPSK